MFDGMSCGRIALDKLGIHVDEYYASEIKPHAIKVVEDNYPDTIQVGDITKLEYIGGVLDNTETSWNIGNIDILMGGVLAKIFL